MEIFWYGQACFKIKGKSTSLIIDPYDPDATGLKLPKDMEAQIALKTHDHPDHNNLKAVTTSPVLVEGPGDYDIKGVAITGISVFHDAQNGTERGKNTVYNIQIDGLNVVHLGDIGHVLNESQIQDIGSCDILMVPVGGNYTISAKEAVENIQALEPRIILPMHYALPGLKYELEGLDLFLKEMGAEDLTPMPKLTITKDKLPEEPQVVLLNKI